MVELGQAGAYLVVHDTKTGPEPLDTPRVGVLKVSEDGLSYLAVDPEDWGVDQEAANDLEAICTIPGRPSEFLVAESGYYKGRFGRIFHLQLETTDDGGHRARVLGFLRPDPLPEKDFITPSPLQFEGMVCLRQGASLVLILGRRGTGLKAGTLSWGSLDLDNYRYREEGTSPLVTIPGLRACADLMVCPRKDGEFLLLSVAASDPGNLGPFRSRVFEAGVVSFAEGELQYSRPQREVVYWQLDGLKVEALTTCHLPDAPVCVGSDDESYLGVWRPLPERLRE